MIDQVPLRPTPLSRKPCSPSPVVSLRPLVALIAMMTLTSCALVMTRPDVEKQFRVARTGEFDKDVPLIVPSVSARAMGGDGWLLTVDSQVTCQRDRYAHTSRESVMGVEGGPAGMGVWIDGAVGATGLSMAALFADAALTNGASDPADVGPFTPPVLYGCAALSGLAGITFCSTAGYGFFAAADHVKKESGPDELVRADVSRGPCASSPPPAAVDVSIGDRHERVVGRKVIVSLEEGRAMFGGRSETADVIVRPADLVAGDVAKVALRIADIPELAQERGRADALAREQRAIFEGQRAGRVRTPTLFIFTSL